MSATMSKTTRLKAKGLPSSITKDVLRTVFKNRCGQGGGPVKNVELNKANGTAVITFENSEAVDIIWRRGKTVKIDNAIITLHRLAPKTNSQSDQSAQVNHASPSDSKRPQNQSGATAEKSVKKKQITTTDAGKKRDVKSRPSLGSRSSLQSENFKCHDEVHGAETLQSIVRRTVKAKVRDVTKSKDFFFYYLNDLAISDGQFDKDSMLLDGLRGYLYVTFHDEKDARALTRITHGKDSNFCSVEIATEDDFNFYKHLISVHGFSFDTEQLLNELAQFISEKTDLEVEDILCYDEPRSVVVVFPPERCRGNIGQIAWKISSQDFFGVRLLTAPVYKNNMVIVSNLNGHTTEDTLVRYLCHSHSGGDSNAVAGPVEWLGSAAIVTLRTDKCVDNILSKALHTLENANLHMDHYHPCLRSDVYEKYIGGNYQQMLEAFRGKESQRPEPAAPRATPRRDVLPKTNHPCLRPSEEPGVETMLSKTPHKLEGRKLKVCHFHPCLTSGMYEEYIERRQQALQTCVVKVKSKKAFLTPRKERSSNYAEASEDEYNEDESAGNEDKNGLVGKTDMEQSRHQLTVREEFRIDDIYELQLLQQINYGKYLQEKFKVRFTMNFYNKLCILEGPQDVIKTANDEFLKKTHEFKQMVIKDLKQEQMELLSTEKTKTKIKEKWKKKTIAACLQLKGDRVVVHYVPMTGYDEKVIGRVVKDQVLMETKPLETDDALAVFRSPKGQEFLSELNETHSDYQANARVKLHAEEMILVIVAPFKRLHEIQNEIDRFVKESNLDDAEVDASREKQEYIDKFNKSELDDIISSLKKKATRVQFQPTTGKIYVKGPKEGVSLGESRLSALYNKVADEKFAISLLGIKRFLGCHDGMDIWQRTERTHSCMIKYASGHDSKADDHGKHLSSTNLRGEASSFGGRTTKKGSGFMQGPRTATAKYCGSNQPDRVGLIVYSSSGRSCEAAKEAMIEACSEKYIKKSEEDPTLKHFHPSQIKELEALGLKHQLHVAVNVDKGVVAIEGFSSVEALWEVQNKLREFTKATYEHHHQSTINKIKAVPAAIQWQFREGDEWKDFGLIANSQLEREYRNKFKRIEIAVSEGQIYHIDVENMKGTRSGKNKAVLDIQRLDRTSAKGEPLPEHWDPMPPKDNLMLVLLRSDSTEYKIVETNFHAAGANIPIRQIQRIQNKALYQQYAVKKREIEARNPEGYQNELILYHGTNAANIDYMNQNGFNRSYSGENATMYGEGVYFAVKSAYSVNYARPDKAGNRLMYQASVLVGMTTPTSRGVRALPYRSGTIPYDSGTDNANASARQMYVIFHDAQAYPEYLITF